MPLEVKESREGCNCCLPSAAKGGLRGALSDRPPSSQVEAARPPPSPPCFAPPPAPPLPEGDPLHEGDNVVVVVVVRREAEACERRSGWADRKLPWLASFSCRAERVARSAAASPGRLHPSSAEGEQGRAADSQARFVEGSPREIRRALKGRRWALEGVGGSGFRGQGGSFLWQS
jgi:hypothetical protein